MAKHRNFFMEIIRILSEEFVRIWFIPFVTSIGIGVLGWFQSIPWFYLCIGTGVMFAAVTTGLLRFSEWKFRVTAKDKLTFADIRVRKRLTVEGMTCGIQMGFVLNNAALFPITFVVQDVQTRFADMYPPKRDYEKNSTIISANGMGWFDDHEISLGNYVPNSQLVEGSICAHLKYGRANHINHDIYINKKIFIKFTDRGDVELINWQDM